MKYRESFVLVIFAVFICACLPTVAVGQAATDNLANVNGGGLSIRWDVVSQSAGGTLTISAPDGRVFTREFRAGGSPDFSLTDKQLEKLPDGVYSYELRLKPSLSAGAREAMKAARGQDDDPESERAGRKRPVAPAVIQSGAFSILNGVIVAGGAVEGQRAAAKATVPQRTPAVVPGNTVTRLRNHRLSLFSMPFDIIHPDDVIIQGSLCVGLDCVNGEVFGFDTIRLKENNTRLQFEDTSAAGFPLNNWQIRANSSAAGGASFLAFVDQGAAGNSETGTIVFEVDAGAPANSLRVASNGKVGLRTAIPVLDLHINTSDTPAHRLEQNSSGGFTAQIWDIAANEANFFVRDVTSGSRLPFRIRPGAPTSSIDIASNGFVGIANSSPDSPLDISTTSALGIHLERSTVDIGQINATNNDFNVIANTNNLSLAAAATRTIVFSDGVTENMRIDGNGLVGIATNAPTDTLSVNGTASKPGGGSWAVFSDERLKSIKGKYTSGLSAVMRLQPLRYQYKSGNALSLESGKEYVGFGAQSLQKVLPEAVTRNDNGYLQVNNDPIIWTMLNAIKEQQKEIEQLKGQIRKLQTSHRRRK